MLDVEQTTLSSEERLLLANEQVGGIILFTRNFESRSQIGELVKEIRECSPDILVAVDQEGGRVQRFREGFEPLPALQKIGRLADRHPEHLEDIAASFGWLMAADILSCGIDISFAPVLDLDTDFSTVIGDRSFSADPAFCIRLAKSYIEGMQAAGMAATAKHFPGHGAVREDSHAELPRDHREFAEVASTDMQPFAALARHFDAVMPGHILFPKIDSQPVGFSSHWLQKVLRDQLGFNGVIFSDDLSMEGAAESGSYIDRAALALEAGCDMVLACNNPEGAMQVLHWLEQNPQSDTGRLQRMRSRAHWDLHTMHADPRYAKAREYLGQINELE